MTSCSFPRTARPLGALLWTAAVLALPGGAAAQTFSGTGAGATPIFVLTSGPTEVTVEAAAGGFQAFLLAIDGSVVAQLSGVPRQDVEVPEDGRYLFEVRTSGEWRISVERPDTTRVLAIRGQIEGLRAAGRSPPAAWLGKGLGAGLLLGPIGTILIVQRAGSETVALDASLEARLAGAPPPYAAAFRDAYREQRRSSQRTAALVGGITGTALLGFVILQLTVWDDGGGTSGNPPNPEPSAAHLTLMTISLH